MQARGQLKTTLYSVTLCIVRNLLETRVNVKIELRNRKKMQFLCFQAVFELMSDSLTSIKVEPHQCPSHESILLTHEILKRNMAPSIIEIDSEGEGGVGGGPLQ